MNETFWYDGNKNLAENRREKDGVEYYIRGVKEIAGKRYERYAVKTHFIGRGEDLYRNINKYVKPLYRQGDILAIGQKVVSMCQNNTVEKKDVKPGFLAKNLSKFAKPNVHGPGLRNIYKFQLIIDMKGSGRVLFAAFCGGFAKLFGKKGVFYKMLGKDISAIDGFYSDSLFDIYHDLAVLYPENPDKICMELQKKGINAMIIDANDLSMDIIAVSENIVPLGLDFLYKTVRDNPEGQDDELTPFIIIRDIGDNPAEPYIPMRPREITV